MGKVTFRTWDKKPRTTLRFLKPGDIFDTEDVHVTDEEAEKWPYYANYGDTNVQDKLDELGFPRSAKLTAGGRTSGARVQ